MKDPHTGAVETLLMAFITLCVPRMRNDTDVVEDVLEVIMVSIMAQPAEIRREAVDSMIRLVLPEHPASDALNALLRPFL